MLARVSLRLALLPLLLFAACGGDDDADAPEPDSEATPTAEGGGESDQEPEDGDDTDDEPTGADGDLPGPGQVAVEVDGQTFTGEAHVCDVAEQSYIVGATTEADGETVEFGSNGARGGSGSWAGQSAVNISGAVAYVSTNGAIEIEGGTVTYTGEFIHPTSNQSTESVGEGRLTANCS